MSDIHKEKWSSHWGFMLAAAGSAIGLGNIWKFPYITGQYGGGAFFLVYLLCILMIGLPIMICELAIGRATGASTVGAFEKLSPKRSLIADLIGGILIFTGLILALFQCYGSALLAGGAGIMILLYGWTFLGIVMGGILPVIIMSYYSVIGGWTLIYIIKSFAGQLNFVDPTGAEKVLAPILHAPRDTWEMVIGGELTFMFLAMIILLCGVRKGIERYSKLLMPILFLLLTALILRSITLPGASEGIKFFLKPDFSKLSTTGILVAMGHAFFTLSLAMGIMITFGSYLKKEENIIKSSISVIALDTLAATMGGLAIFPAVFAMGFQPDSGPGLIYQILPAAFNQIPGNLGWLWNGLFFLMIFIAALTSSISLMEPAIAIGMEQFKLPRKISVIFVTGTIALLGIFCALSMSSWSNISMAGDVLAKYFEPLPNSLFEALDSFSCNWLLPLAGLATTIYVGWIWGTHHALKEIRKGMTKRIDINIFILLAGLQKDDTYQNQQYNLPSFAMLWGFFIRWITPILVLIAFLNGIKFFG